MFVCVRVPLCVCGGGGRVGGGGVPVYVCVGGWVGGWVAGWGWGSQGTCQLSWRRLEEGCGNRCLVHSLTHLKIAWRSASQSTYAVTLTDSTSLLSTKNEQRTRKPGPACASAEYPPSRTLWIQPCTEPDMPGPRVNVRAERLAAQILRLTTTSGLSRKCA